jgi:hypothetical protein
MAVGTSVPHVTAISGWRRDIAAPRLGVGGCNRMQQNATPRKDTTEGMSQIVSNCHTRERCHPSRDPAEAKIGRLRNLRETPKESPLFQRYLKTLEEQEEEMDDLQAKLKTLHGDEAKTRSAYDDYLANLSAE